jgi:hypothetical protein
MPVVHGELRLVKAIEGLTEPHFRMDCRVKPGNDAGVGNDASKNGRRRKEKREAERRQTLAST